ncbi:hypothetical protein [Fimbriiglobus ruber]|uniref:Uncharacterized protein n=1 Tax=Fimbriiglobus ruber TaxID=1908690 RepID=A0A225E1J7_9BACT|nr:hypothetical protein [Fimbriiglobus ruber]OWK45654.1 hypothetical protein FRUB_01985 [Fimbriiglobus ruber]
MRGVHVRLLLARVVGPAAVVLALAAASPPDIGPPDELIRLGNDAFLRGDAARADQLFATAGERTADPGLVAFNRAAVAVQKHEFREAEEDYTRVLDDRAAPPARRARALYNRGVCLLNRGGSAATLRSAIAYFEQAIDVPGSNAALTADAQHNLELAKLLWNRARAQEKVPPRPNDLPQDLPPPEPPPQRPDTDNDPNPPGDDPFGANGGAGKLESGAGAAQKGQQQRETRQQTPGAGSLPVRFDPNPPQALSPEDTRAYLRQINARLNKDRRDNIPPVPERPHVRDW